MQFLIKTKNSEFSISQQDDEFVMTEYKNVDDVDVMLIAEIINTKSIEWILEAIEKEYMRDQEKRIINIFASVRSYDDSISQEDISFIDRYYDDN